MRYSIEAVRPSRSGKIPLLPRALMTLLALAFFFAGIGVFLQHLSILRTWLPVEATVVRSEVIGHRNQKQRNMYRGAVELAYTVAGREYRIPDTFSTATSSESTIRLKMESTYAPGTRHRIFYDPANPYSHRWDVGFNFTFFLVPTAFTGVGLILIAVCYFLWRLPYPPRLACRRCGNRGRLDDRYCPRCGDALAPDSAAPVPNESAPIDQNSERLSKRENPAALLLVGAFFGLPGLACCLGAAYMGINNYVATQTWPTTEATVIRSAIETTRDRKGMPVYRLSVEFDYEGEQHPEHAAGKSIYVSGSYAGIAERLERFPAGSRHEIRVNPRDPADIRFDLENPLLNWLPTAGLGLFGFIFAAIGAALLRWCLKSRCASCRCQLPRGAPTARDAAARQPANRRPKQIPDDGVTHMLRDSLKASADREQCDPAFASVQPGSESSTSPPGGIVGTAEGKAVVTCSSQCTTNSGMSAGRSDRWRLRARSSSLRRSACSQREAHRWAWRRRRAFRRYA